MEGQKRRRVFSQKRYNTQKRFLALVLAFAMIFTSVGTDLNAAYAAEGNRVDFEIYGADLVEAINDAVETQSPVTADDLDFTNGAIEKFDALFFGEGRVYEVFPAVEGGDMDAEIRVFVRLPQDADDMYMVTGDEEVIFLYINNGEDTISCSTKIIRTVDGEEKAKSTKRITVKSYEDKFGDEESNIISKPEETVPSVPETDGPGAPQESMPEETPSETETAVPEETTVPDATEESSETEESEDAAESTESQEAGTEATEAETETAEAETEATEAETEATEAETEAAEAETEAAEDTEASVEENTEEKSQDDSAVTISSISRHQVPVVAETEAAEEKEETAAESEEAETTEAETEESESEEPESTEAEETTAEETTAEETTTAPEESTEETSSEAESGEETTAVPEESTTAPETEETAESTEAETTAPEETTAPAETQPPVQTATPAEPEEDKKPAATDSDLVGMGWCSTAKAYTTTLNALKVFENQMELTADVAGAENVTVTLSAMPGVIPEGSYVEAEAITDEGQLDLMKKAADEQLMKKDLAAVDIFAADITLYDADGNEIQPDGSVKVTFEGTGIDSASSVVYHMSEDGNGPQTFSLFDEENPYTAEKVTSAPAEGSDTAFMTDHFSIYANIETEETYYYEVNFYYKDGQEDVLISGIQYVKEGEEPIQPDAPVLEGKHFVGWEPEVGPIAADTGFYAQYAENAGEIYLRVNYQYSDGSSAAQPWVAEVQAGVKCDYTVESPEIDGFVPDHSTVEFKDAYNSDQTVTVTYTGAEGNYTVQHWQLDVQGNKVENPVETEEMAGEVGTYTQAKAKTYEGFTAREISQVRIGSDGSTVVEVLYERNTYTLTWDTGEGGSYIAPSEVVYGAAVKTPAKNPSKLGYEFVRWSNLPETMPAQDTVVTAEWRSAAKADYKVIYWKETLTQGEYAVGDITYGKDGSVGNNIPYDNHNNKYEGFKLNADKSAGDVQITADGMAVKNVYYDRETYTITFWRLEKSGPWYNPQYDWVEDTSLKITARYGEDVHDRWKKACENDGWGPNQGDRVQYTLIANMPAKNLTVYEKTGNIGRKPLTYYIEGLRGNYDEYAAFGVSGDTYLTEEDKQPITGFEFETWKNTGNPLWLKYSRNSYNLYFENCASMKPASIKFQAPLLSGRPQSDPGRPADIEDDYDFDGWYLDPAFTTSVDWDATMPADNITIYAKWKAPEYTVSFETNGGTDIDPITVIKGDMIELPANPEKEGDIFLGWYTDADFTKKFIPESKIVEDITLYAKWESSDTVTYTVRYVTEVNGGQTELSDSKEGSAKLGTSVTEEAVAIEGYYPRSMFLTQTISKSGMTITFVYDPVKTWSYTVKYLLEGSDTPVAEEETYETTNHAVAVNFKPVEGYTLKTNPVVTVTKDSPEAVFYYTTQKAFYHTQHWFEALNGEFGLHSIDTVSDEAAGKNVQATPLMLEGFTYDPGHEGEVASGTTDIHKILTMKLYYTRNQHQVKYEIAGDVPDGVVLPLESTQKYKSQITVEAPLSVPGYTFTGWTTDDVQVNNGKFIMPDRDVVLTGSFTESAAVRISYRPDNAAHGSVSSEGEDVKPATGTPSGSTASEKDGWAFKYWTKDGTIVSWEKELSKAVIDANSKADGLYVASEYVAVFGEDENGDKIPDEYQVRVTYEAVNGTVSLAETYVTLYKDGHYATSDEGGVGKLEANQIADASPLDGFELSTEQWKANGEVAKKPTIETEITQNTTYVVTFGKNGYVYDVVKRYLDVNGNLVDEIVTSATALYGENILEVSGVTVLQEEVFRDEFYELVSVDGADRLITNDLELNHVEIIYQQKEYGYDVVKRFLNAAGEEVDAVTKLGTAAYGTNILEASDVTVLQEELHDGNLYELVKVEGADLLITNDIQANHVEIIYQQKNYNYEVVKHYEGLNETVVESTKGEAPYGTGILEMSKVDVLQHETYKDHTYVLVKVDGADKLVTNDETQNRIDIYYTLDEKGGTDPTDPTNPDKPDGHPDKYQIIFRYVSADDAMGTVSVTETEVHTFTDNAGNYIDKYPISPDGAAAQALAGFAFDYWADTEGRDYTADMQRMKSQTYLEDTTFTAHFAEDKIGETDPQNPDGIPDKYQITFRYVPENPSYGTVSGTVVEVRTIITPAEGENGYQVLETRSVNPFADVTVSGNGRYSFARWSDGTTNFANADEISAASYNADTTFTAYFAYNGGGSSGGGGGGGNSGGPSGSGGNSSGGPGVTVTIDSPDVPLASLPSTASGDVIAIDDGMVPMAPLPKTGQTTMRSTLLMAFSGILLAIAGLGKKRKEEEN